MRWTPVCCLLLSGLAPPVRAQDANKPTPASKVAEKTFQVPYRLTDTKHVLVRAKINGKGPFNFIVDTGAPALFVGTAVCKKVGVAADGEGWGTFDRFEIEGGVVLTPFRGRVEDPFQLEGMNGLGLAGATLHGIIGYTVLARYRIEFDFTKDKLSWTRLDFAPPEPLGLAGKGGGAPGGLDAVGGMMKMMGAFLGMTKRPDPRPRGALGLELRDEGGKAVVHAVLPNGPAAAAEVKPGDRVTHLNGKATATLADMHKHAEKIVSGQEVELKVDRAGETITLRLRAGEGL